MASLSLFQEPSHQVIQLVKDSLPIPMEDIADSVPLPHSQEPGYSAIYRNAFSKDGLFDTPHPALNTLYNLFTTSAQVHKNDPCLGTRHRQLDGSMGPYTWESFDDISRRRTNLGAGLFFVLQNNPYKLDCPGHQKIDQHLHMKDGINRDSFVVSIFSANRSEWCITDLACTTYSIVSTALYDTLGPQTSQYILEVTESPIIICSKDKVASLIELKEKYPQELKHLITIVSMDPLNLTSHSSEDSYLHERALANKLTLFDFKQVERFGEIYPLKPIIPTPSTVYTISFTSGTTGANPKGVVLTNRNAVAAITFVLSNIQTERARSYCFLPLAHIYERMNLNFALSQGVAIGMPQSPSPLTLLDDIKSLRPNILSLVPRVYTKLEAAIKAQTIDNYQKPLLQRLFSRAIETKLQLQSEKDGAEGRHIVYDRLLYLLRKKIGFENVTALTTGSAPIAPSTVKFMKASLNTGMSQGYGLTESFAGVCCSQLYDSNPGSCGAIAITTEMRLREIPEMGYHANDAEGPKGELLLRGPQIFSEYYKNPEETAKALDKEGWFHTGDIAKIDAKSGRLYIIDRVKNFFKLAQGEYITPEKVENSYLSSFPLVQQCYAHGDSLKTFLVAIIGVDPESIKAWLKRRFNISGAEVSEVPQLLKLLNDREIKKKFLSEMNASVSKQLSGLERVHNIQIDIEPLTVARNVITPTLKIKRPIASKFFAEQLEKLYEEGSLIKSEQSKF